MYNKEKNWVSNLPISYLGAVAHQEETDPGTHRLAGIIQVTEAIQGSGNSFYQPSAYERAKSSGQSSYNWFNSKLKEAGNIWNSWTKGMEKTVKHFCTTAKRIKKDAVRYVE